VEAFSLVVKQEALHKLADLAAVKHITVAVLQELLGKVMPALQIMAALVAVAVAVLERRGQQLVVGKMRAALVGSV
jgi:hypothetical protein